jgi:hypothetical protein
MPRIFLNNATPHSLVGSKLVRFIQIACFLIKEKGLAFLLLQYIISLAGWQ